MGPIAVGPDTVVTLSYVLFDENGEAVDRATQSEPLEYVHGYAQIVPGLERGLTGLEAGAKREIVVAPEEGFGERDEDGVFEVDKSDFPNQGEVVRGDEFVAQGADGEAIAMRVVDILPDAFVVDTNHPLAGQKLRFEVEVHSVRAATEEELETAQAELEAQLDDHDGCCGEDHDHDHDHHHGDGLVQLGKKA